MDFGDGFWRGGVPVLEREETIDKYLFAIKKNLLSKEDTIEHLREQLKTAQDEAYASKEMQKMKAELQKMNEDYWRGFPISKDEGNAINHWQKEHDAKEHSNPNGYHGCSGGGYVYTFYPTAIGTSGECICCICQKRARIAAATADTPARKKNGYDEAIYREYMDTHGGYIEFQELG